MDAKVFLKNLMNPEQFIKTISIDEFSIDEIIKVSNSIEEVLKLPGISKQSAHILSEFNISLNYILETECEELKTCMIGYYKPALSA